MTEIKDNMNDEMNKEKKKRKPRITKTKAEKYEKEQKEIVERLNEIIGIDEKNNKFIMEELREDKQKLEKILELEEEVKRYFAYGNWGYFKGKILEETKGISLARGIYNASGYEINYKLKQKEGKKYTEYNIRKGI
jgi:hypothetical protein